MTMEPSDNRTSSLTPPTAARLSRRSFLTRSGYSVAALLALSQWDGVGTPPVQAQTTRGGGFGGGKGARLGATSVARLSLPLWGDNARWDDDHYYPTMQAGRRYYAKTYQFSDVDGDGREEMLIRGPQGLVVMKWDAPNTQWIPLPGTPLSDFADNPDGTPLDYKYTATIQTCDFDGDGVHEIIGRFADGLWFFKYYPATQKWTRILSPSFCTDDTGWGDSPSYYQTIQCAPILSVPPNDSSTHPRYQIIGRGADGVVAINYDAPTGQWSVIPTYSRFSDQAGWNQGAYFWSTIQCADVDGDGIWELVARSGGGLEIHKLQPDGQTWWQSPITYAGWNDNNAWHVPPQYSTIQCADIDGDGRAEIMGNGVRGLETLRYDPVSHAIGYYNPSNPYLNDTSAPIGWNAHPFWYESIQFADIDGDGAMEMIARAGTPGIMAFKFDKTAKVWVRFAEGPVNQELSDSNGFDEIQYYATFQSASILLPGDPGYTGDGTHRQAVVIVRGSACVLTYRFDVPSKTWVFCKNGPPPDYSSDPNKQAAYMAIAPALNYIAPNGIRSAYNSEGFNIPQQLEKMYLPPPFSYDMPNRPKTILQPVNAVDPDAWEQVVWQIYWEMNWVESVRGWLLGDGGDDVNAVGPLINAIYGQASNVLNNVNGYLSVPDNTGVAMNILSLIGNAGWAILGVPELNAGTASAIAGMIGVAAGAGGEFSNDVYSGALSGLQSAIVDNCTAAVHGNISICNQIIGGRDSSGNVMQAEYGLLKLFGDNIYRGVWAWPIQDLLTPAERAYATQCWQTLMGVSSFVDMDADNQFNPYQWTYNEDGVINHGLLANGLVSSTNGGVYPDSTLGALFDPIDPAHWHPLAINKQWVYKDFSHGWPVLKDDEGNIAGQVIRTPPKPAINPTIQVTPKLTRDAKTGEIVVTITFANRGVRNATNVQFTSVKLGTKSNLPNVTKIHHFLRSNYPETVEVRFPSLAAGTKTTLSIQGKYKGGTFGTSLRITIPG